LKESLKKIKISLYVLALAVGLCALLTGASPVSAEGSGIVVTTNAPVSLIVNGLQVSSLPATVASGSTVSVPTTLYYVTEQERWVFQKWSHGPLDTSVMLTQNGVYQAVYQHEVLLQISSVVTSLQKSMWVTAGIPLNVEVPNVVQAGDNVRYRFASWNAGEQPYQASNTIAPVKPTVLEVNWVKEYLLTIDTPESIAIAGSGWYADGASVVLQAPDAVYDVQNTTKRLKFDSWESQGFPPLVVSSPNSPVISVKMDGTYKVKANYQTQYLVVANTPFGTLKRDWINEGDEVVLDALPVVEIIADQEQFIFKEWQGMSGLVSPKVSGVVNAPVELTAVYDHQYMVTVDAPFGSSGGGWYTAGSIATITVPSSAESAFSMKKRFMSFPGYGKEPVIQVPVQAAMTITALYSAGADFGVLALILLLLLAILATIVLVRRRSLN
jgi:hypothetical protein